MITGLFACGQPSVGSPTNVYVWVWSACGLHVPISIGDCGEGVGDDLHRFLLGRMLVLRPETLQAKQERLEAKITDLRREYYPRLGQRELRN